MRTITAIIISMMICAPAFADEYIAASSVYTEVSKAYKENELAAEERYKGVRIKIGGFVKRIDKDLLGRPTVTLDAGSLRFVVCEFDKHTNQLRDLIKLKKGSYFKGQGTIRNKMLTTLFLENCVIESYHIQGSLSPQQIK